MKRILIQILIFAAIFLLAELVLRGFGMKAGTLIDDFKIENNPVYQKRFLSDEVGINHLIPDAENLMYGTKINGQGFRGSFEYTREVIDSIKEKTKKEVVMMIGDSYVEGCCPDSVSNSFPDLIEKHSDFKILNFGVSGTDPIQYELVAKKYVKLLKPDRVVVVFYFGNDILFYERKPTPGVPLTYPFKNNKWLYGVAPNHLSQKMNFTFSGPKEAYDFYIRHYTITGRNRNPFEKALSHSVILSKIYLFIEHKIAKMSWERKHPNMRVDGAAITNRGLKEMIRIFNFEKVPYIFVAIPAPGEAEEGLKLKEKYKDVFKDIVWSVPSDLTIEDYDGSSSANHFNNEGHKKFEKFLLEILQSKKN